MITVEGWVIMPLDATRAGASYTTFGKTVVEAWSRHVGQYQTLDEMHQRIMDWTARGYAPRKAKLTIEMRD